MKKTWIWAAFLASTLFLGAGTASGYAISRGSDNRVPDRVAVGGLPIGGLSASDAIVKIQARIAAVGQIRVALEGEGSDREAVSSSADGRQATLGMLGMSIEATEAIEDLARYRDAKWWNRSKRKRHLKSDYPVQVSWNEETFAEQAETRWAKQAEAAPQNAVRTIDASDQVVYTSEIPGTTLDTAALFAAVKRIAPASLAEEPTGKGGNGDEGRPESGKTPPLPITLPLAQVRPEVSVASLKAEGISRKIAEFTTAFTTSGAGRSHNVEVTAKALDDTLLMPGEIFDYGAIVAKAEREYGYQEAPVIVKGKLTPGIGGGICQVSSTLYNAIIRTAGIEIVERRNHSLVVHYLPAGLDATFADGYINFRFRNTTGKQLLIKTVVADKQLTVKLFGTMDESITYELETVQQRLIAPKTTYVADDTVALGDDRLLQRGEPGYVIDTFRLKYVAGKLRSREKLNRSTYKAVNEQLAVNQADDRIRVKSEPSPAPDGNTPVEPL